MVQQDAVPNPGFVGRPDYVSGNAVTSDYTTTLQYLNTSAFAAVPISSASGLPFVPEASVAEAVRGPGLWNADLSLGKNFTIAEKAQLNARLTW